MQPLHKSLRNKLERTIKEARDTAEAAAKAALEQLGVGEAVPDAHLSVDDRELRRRLRGHGRQLGDIRNPKTETQEIARLTEEVAYEHWHRMLFARFLAENNLLMYWAEGDNEPIDINLDTCQELIDEGEEEAGSKWEVAARLAARMLPQIFRPDSPVFQLILPPEHELKLERLVADLPQEVFTASDSLGWVYQFWQAKRKDEVNASEVKIGARELPAVTQLFTEPYMVAYLLDNSLGAWWVAKVAGLREGQRELISGAREILRTAGTEKELRKFFALPGMPLDYLRFIKDNGRWLPATGTFDGWPDDPAKLKILDPCCGSGHFLVAAFLMVVAMRMELEGYSPKKAVDAALIDNIHGMELDQRCVEIAAFALAFTAWRYPGGGGYRLLPQLHLACTGFSISSTREQWMAILEGQNLGTNLRFFFGQLYDLFKKAPILGSLINPSRFLGSAWLGGSEMSALYRALDTAVKASTVLAIEQQELGVTAKGLALATELLADRYTLLVTNVPYLGRGKQDDILKEYLEEQYPLGKADLATAFVLRCLEFNSVGGSTALVTPQNWFSLSGYTKLRQMLLQNRAWNAVARLGSGAFETISGHIVNVALPILSAVTPKEKQTFAGVDVSAAKNPEEKALRLTTDEIMPVEQARQLENPDVRIGFQEIGNSTLINLFAECYQGIVTGDIERFTRNHWEVPFNKEKWVPFRRSNNSPELYGDVSEVLLWEKGIGDLHSYARDARDQLHDMHESGNRAWGRHGVAINRMGDLRAVPYYGEHFDNNVAVVFSKGDESINSALLAYLRSASFASSIRELDQTLKVTNRTLLKIPFDLPYWSRIAQEQYPNGLPKPYSDDPTQWIFHGNPVQCSHPLQVAVARLVGYRWPAEMDQSIELSDESTIWLRRSEELANFADDDGIVCIPPVRGEAAAADRLLNLLVKSYGGNWRSDTLNYLLKNVGFAGKGLDQWLRDAFFAQHCELFYQRPFVWHIWDGLRDGFSALVNYHKLDYKNLETLIYTYLGDWISRQKQDKTQGVDGAEERLAAAEQLKKKLELILEGEAPYDIFVRWKPAYMQAIGWQPDTNDGVRLNIRPFATVPDVKTKGAGVLRMKPKIKWEKDRGKEPRRTKQDFPWFWGWDGSTDFVGDSTFTGDRYNDCHYSLSFKHESRRQAGKE